MEFEVNLITRYFNKHRNTNCIKFSIFNLSELDAADLLKKPSCDGPMMFTDWCKTLDYTI